MFLTKQIRTIKETWLARNWTGRKSENLLLLMRTAERGMSERASGLVLKTIDGQPGVKKH